MDFALTPEQEELRKSMASFGLRHLGADDARARDAESCFDRTVWQECAAFGILGLCAPEAYGGSGQDALTAVVAMEGLGYGGRDNGLIFALNAQMWSVQAPLQRFGSDAQREQYLGPLVSGAIIGAHAMTEPGSGSDPFSLTTTARKEADAYVLNGAKTFVSNAPIADVLLAFATTDPARGFMGITAFLVPRDTPGVTIGRPMEKMGLRTSPMAEVFFDECRVSADARLGREGNGGAIFRHSMAWERLGILASYIGTMERQLERVIEHTTTRVQFGRRLSSFQAVSHRIVDMKVRLESARLLLRRAAWKMDRGETAAMDIAMAKLAIS